MIISCDKKNPYFVKETVIFSPFTEELEQPAAKTKSAKAPGLGCISGEVLKLVDPVPLDDVLGVYNDLAVQGNFQEEWKSTKQCF